MDNEFDIVNYDDIYDEIELNDLQYDDNYCYGDIFILSKLPDSLNNKEIIEYFKMYKNGDLEARDKLIRHNTRLVSNQIAKKFSDTKYDKKIYFQ